MRVLPAKREIHRLLRANEGPRGAGDIARQAAHGDAERGIKDRFIIVDAVERIRDLERLLGRKTLEIEILREALAKSKKKPSLLLVAAEGWFAMKAVADTLGVARSNLHDKVRRAAKPRGSYRKTEDEDLLAITPPPGS